MRRVDGYPLWLGNVGDTRQATALFAAGIQAVVELAANEEPAKLPREFLHCRFPLNDGAGNDAAVLRLAISTVASLLEQQIPTLVYCGMGMSRTPAIAAAAIAVTFGGDSGEALTKITASAPADVSTSLWADVQACVAAMRASP